MMSYGAYPWQVFSSESKVCGQGQEPAQDWIILETLDEAGKACRGFKLIMSISKLEL